MADISLLALYWTVAGPVEIHAGREWSTFSWRERCETVAAGAPPALAVLSLALGISTHRPRGRHQCVAMSL